MTFKENWWRHTENSLSVLSGDICCYSHVNKNIYPQWDSKAADRHDGKRRGDNRAWEED